MNIRVFKITAKTKLHVGNESGGEFTIIDKTIQRDPLTSLPCINSSSLKGAIKEYCYYRNKGMDLNKKDSNINIPTVNIETLFGSGIDEDGKVMPNSQKGEAIFFDAKILYLPQQDNNNFYHYITSQEVIDMMNERIKLFGLGDTSYIIESQISSHQVECIDNKVFISSCNNHSLPIIARNVLENGESQNLWYEQVLPAETILYTIILEKGDELKNALDGNIVQIGAGATIGYGYCEFALLFEKNGQNDSSSSHSDSPNNESLPYSKSVEDGRDNSSRSSSSTHNNDYQNRHYQSSNDKSKKKKGRR